VRAALPATVRSLRNVGAGALPGGPRPRAVFSLRAGTGRPRGRGSIMTAPAELLRVEKISKTYAVRKGIFGRSGGRLRAVDGVSLSIDAGETLGLVGESGSGKTTCGRLIARLEEPDSGRIWFDGEDWLAISGEPLRRRRRNLQVVFQDPQ